MKLLKYVITNDSGLAPNPYFGVCSLALCTPNHMNAKLSQGDWIVGHTTKATGNRLVYAMQLTKILSMEEYFSQFPEKRPNPFGSIEQQYGDNMYFREDGRWLRIPSAAHNCVESFQQDQGRQVFLAEGEDAFWYFGAANSMPASLEFPDRFPMLIQSRQGITYIRNREYIQRFSNWLSALGTKGLLDTPQNQVKIWTDRYLLSIDPEPVWCAAKPNGCEGQSAKASCTRSTAQSTHIKRKC